MRHLWMGNVPPRLGGVRVYEKNTHDDEVTITQSPTDIIPIILTTISMIRAVIPIIQVVIDLDLMYSGDGSLAFSLQSMRCEIKKAKITFLMWKIMWRCWTKSAHFMLFVDNMLLKGVCEKHSASDSKTDHELSSLHRRRRGALSFYNHIGSFVSVIVNLVITSLVIVVEFTSF